MKRFITILAALCLLLSVVPCECLAAGEYIAVEKPAAPICVTLPEAVQPTFYSQDKPAAESLRNALWATLNTEQQQTPTLAYQADAPLTQEEIRALTDEIVVSAVGYYEDAYFCWRFTGYEEDDSIANLYWLHFAFVTVKDWGTLSARLQAKLQMGQAVTETVTADGEIPQVFLEQYGRDLSWKLRQTAENDLCIWEYRESQQQEENRYALTFAPVMYRTQIDDAAADLREGMMQRKEKITLHCLTNNLPDASTMENLLEKAVAHTGEPAEGDYLRLHYGTQISSSSCVSMNGEYFVTLTYEIGYYTTAAQEAEMDSFVADFLKSEAMQNACTDYQKVRVIYGWLCDNVTYDYDNLENDAYKLKHSAYAAAIDRKAVCQGYALLLYRLALSCGIDARAITGKAGTEDHAWNIVKMGEKYYLLDATWDAGKQTEQYQYFLRGSGNFADHTAAEDYNYTALGVSTADYVPTEADLAELVRGDLNGDKMRDAGDMQWLYERLCGDKMLAENERELADVNGDTLVNILDYQALYQLIVLGA